MKIEKIPKNILRGVRGRMGLNQNLTEFDAEIEKMTPYELMEKWLGWTLGDEHWAYENIGAYENLKQIDKEN